MENYGRKFFKSMTAKEILAIFKESGKAFLKFLFLLGKAIILGIYSLFTKHPHISYSVVIILLLIYHLFTILR